MPPEAHVQPLRDPNPRRTAGLDRRTFMITTSRSKPAWKDVKVRIQELDRAGLLALIQDLYAANKGNQAFLHARFSLGEDVLGPYKQTIDRWLSPDVFRGQDVSVSKAKQAVADLKKAGGHPANLAELMVLYCERAAGFSADVGMDDAVYLDALVSM